MDHRNSGFTDAQLARVVQSCGDFQQALSALTFLLEECDYEARHSIRELRKYRCYENAAIVAFARPFEVSRGRTVLGLRAVGVRLDAQEEELKSKIIELRRKVVAHSDEEHMQFSVSTIQPLEDSPVALPTLLFQESLRLRPADVADLQALVRKLVRSIATTLFALAQREPERLSFYKFGVN